LHHHRDKKGSGWAGGKGEPHRRIYYLVDEQAGGLNGGVVDRRLAQEKRGGTQYFRERGKRKSTGEIARKTHRRGENLTETRKSRHRIGAEGRRREERSIPE